MQGTIMQRSYFWAQEVECREPTKVNRSRDHPANSEICVLDYRYPRGRVISFFSNGSIVETVATDVIITDNFRL